MTLRNTTSALALAAGLCAPLAAHADDALPTKTVGEVVVTASRTDLLGKADSASQGAVTREEVQLRPIFRIGRSTAPARPTGRSSTTSASMRRTPPTGPTGCARSSASARRSTGSRTRAS